MTPSWDRWLPPGDDPPLARLFAAFCRGSMDNLQTPHGIAVMTTIEQAVTSAPAVNGRHLEEAVGAARESLLAQGMIHDLEMGESFVVPESGRRRVFFDAAGEIWTGLCRGSSGPCIDFEVRRADPSMLRQLRRKTRR